eukprot:scaffold458_cov150-Amphora_coffeaeformis.AAC.4
MMFCESKMGRDDGVGRVGVLTTQIAIPYTRKRHDGKIQGVHPGEGCLSKYRRMIRDSSETQINRDGCDGFAKGKSNACRGFFFTAVTGRKTWRIQS